MGIKGVNRYLSSGAYQRYGMHQPSKSHRNEFISRHCPPSRRIVQTPGAKRMRVVSGKGSADPAYTNIEMPVTTDLLQTYEEKRAQGKVFAQGTGHEPRRWEYLWPESAMNAAQNAESKGLSTKPFIDMLLEPISKRPRTFAQCVSFFYPLSGMVPPAVNISPFISTSVVAYDVPDYNPRLGGSLPLQLGEVSMMYGWYLAFQLMLCPETEGERVKELLKQSKSASTYPFNPIGLGFLQDASTFRGVSEKLREKSQLLSDIKDVVTLMETAAVAATSGGVALPTSIPELLDAAGNAVSADNIKEWIQRYGPAAIASIVREYIDVPYTHANDIATLIVEGAISPQKYASLLNDTSANAKAVQSIIKDYALGQAKSKVPEGLVDGLAGAADDLSALFVLDEIPTKVQQKYNQLKADTQINSSFKRAFMAAFEARKRELSDLAESKILEFSKYGNARSNEPVTLTVIAIGLTASAIRGGLDYQRSKYADRDNNVRNYLSTNVYQIDPNLATSDIAFQLGKNVRRGVWADFTWPTDNNWENSHLRPDCELQQGGQVLDYWIHAWSRVTEFCRRFDKARSNLLNTAVTDDHYPIHLGQLLPKTGSDGLRVVEYKCEHLDPNDSSKIRCSTGNIPRERTFGLEESYVRKGHTRCQGLGLLANFVDDSLWLVLNNAEAFSPFTHAYGFSPIFRVEPSTGNLHIDGKAPRRYLGSDNLVFKDSENRKRAAAAPGHIYPYKDLEVSRSTAYDILGVECWAGQGPLPSRRLLKGAYGQRCSISFDVGIDDQIPVMDAQFCGLMACLYLHPEALETCSKLGLPWAQNLEKRKQTNLTALLSSISSTFQFIPGLLPSKTGLMTNLMRISKDGLVNKTIQFTPAIQLNIHKIVKDALANKITLSPDVLKRLKTTTSPTTTPQKLTTKAAELSTTNMIASALTVTAVTAGLSWVVYKVHKAGK